MDSKYICYCGLYCENCAVRARINPAAKTLYNVIEQSGFDSVMSYIPNGDIFWQFLKNMSENEMCVSCKEGSGYPECAIRKCAQSKNVEACAWCENYACEHFDVAFKAYPVLMQDNALLRDKGIEAWGSVQDERIAAGFTYTDSK